jgi:HAE1 family hydrophobic/amphiphilic exporter-1
MWLTSIAIRRPLLLLMAFGVLLIAGGIGWTRLGVDLLPSLDAPVMVVTTQWPGAGAESVDAQVTRPIEDALVGMNDLDFIQSSSLEGVSVVEVVFTDKASQNTISDLERHLDAARDQLPPDIKPWTVAKFDPNAQPILGLTLAGAIDPGQLQQIAENVQQQIQATSGVGQVTLVGGVDREIQVQVDPTRLQGYGLSILQVTDALSADNLNIPAGTVTQSGQSWTIRLNSQIRIPADLNTIPLASTSGGTIYLRDVATVVDTVKDATQYQRANGQGGVGIFVSKQATANTLSTVDAVKATVARIQSTLPPGVSIATSSDASTFVRSSVQDVQHELTQAIALTALVLLLFLHSLRSTAIVLTAIPTSLIATLGVMYFLGLSLNMMSLLGLTLTVGILVDDSIVVLENIFRHLQRGETPFDAAFKGRAEIGLAAVAITLVDVVVFAPIAFMSGAVGQYFRQFGLVIVTATLFSLLVSFTLTPMLASRWCRARPNEGDGLKGLVRLYRRILRFAISRVGRWLVLAGGVATFVGAIALVATGVVSTEFLPPTDSGEVQVTLELPAGASLDATNAAAQQLEQQLLALPETAGVFTSVGVSDSLFTGAEARRAQLQVELKDRGQRTRSADQVASAIRVLGGVVPGALVEANATNLLGNSSSPIQIRIQGEDQTVLASLAAQVADIVRSTPGTTDVRDGGVTGQPEQVVTIDRDRAADAGLTPAQVASVLRTGLSGSTVTTYRPAGSKGFDVRVVLDPNQRARLEQLPQIPVLTPKGVVLRLGQVAHVDPSTGPTQVDRRDRQRLVTVTADTDGRPTGDVARDIQTQLDRLAVPSGYQVAQGGAASDQGDAFTQLLQALALSVLLMYMLMVALFESLLLPFVVMLSLPLSLVGAFGLLALTGNTLNMVSMIGMILLAGLVGKNAILLIDVVNTRRRQGLTRDESLLLAAPTRLRPILMTTATIVLAMLPVAAKLGEGGELRAPLAVAVIGGLMTSTLLTLVLVPAVYTLLDDLQAHIGRAMGVCARGAEVVGRYVPLVRLSTDAGRRLRAYRERAAVEASVTHSSRGAES